MISNMREIERITNNELEHNIYGGLKSSWHDKYRDSAWIYLGGLSYELSEGDIICVSSQWGEIEDINLVRDKVTNKSLGYAFIKYEDQRSTILAVDNFNGSKLLGLTLRCDHVENYRLPKEIREMQENLLSENPNAKIVLKPGQLYEGKELENRYNITSGVNIWSQDKDKKSKKHSSNDKKEKKKRKHEDVFRDRREEDRNDNEYLKLRNDTEIQKKAPPAGKRESIPVPAFSGIGKSLIV